MRYFVAQYEEAPVAPETAHEFKTLAEARRYAKQRWGYKLDTTQRGECYADGSRHVEAYYENEHRSSGCWITSRED